MTNPTKVATEFFGNIIRNVRFNEQAFLRDNIKFFGGNGIAMKAGTASPGGNYKHFVKISNTSFDAQALQQSKKEVKEGFLNLTPAQVSSLVPYIDVYKVFFEGETLRSARIPFENYIDSRNLKAITSDRKGRGGGSGILDFSWTENFAVGGVPAIKASMKLFFQDTSALTRVYKVKDGISVTPAELLKLGPLGQVVKGEPAPSIRVSCGWAAPNGALKGNLQLDAAARASVETTGITFVLSPTHVDLDYGLDGTITATIEYVGVTTAETLSDAADVLSIRSDKEKQLDAKIEEKEREEEIRRGILDGTSDGFSTQPLSEVEAIASFDETPSEAELETGTSSEKAGVVESRERSESLEKEIQVLELAVIDEKFQKLFEYIKNTNNLFYADVPYDTIDSYIKSASNGNSIDLKGVTVNQQNSSSGKIASAASASSNQPGPAGASDTTPGADAASGSTIPTEGGSSSYPTSQEPNQSIPAVSDGPPASFPAGAAPLTGGGSTTSPSSGGNPDRAKSKQIPFTYLGAVIDAGFQGLLDSWIIAEVRQRMIFRNLVGQVQFQVNGLPHWENMADIPVSIEVLRGWFSKNCIQTNRKFWSIGQFLRSVLDNLLKACCEPQRFGVKKTNYGIRGKLEQRQIALTSSGADPFIGERTAAGFNLVPFVNLGGKSVPRFEPGSRLGLFLFLLQDNDDVSDKKDLVTITPGKNRGIVKSVRFSRNQSAGQRALGAAITVNSLAKGENNPYFPDFRSSVLGSYTSEIEMFGNSLFQLGSADSQFIINLGGLFASPELDLAEVSNIEGEYQVTKITNSISSQQYTTTVQAQRTAGPSGSLAEKRAKGRSATPASAKPKESA